MNIAVAIGVSEYTKENKLPACRNDAKYIHDLLIATGKYSDVLLLNENATASNLKDSLRSFFGRFADKQVEEVFFYFSGHGSYHSALEDVLLCAADFDSRRPSFTSLANQEVDDLLRSLSPKLAVKVIDACNSGAQYIKDADAGDKFEKALRDSKLAAFHFMASSRLDQSSYANKDGSHFTSKFMDGALAKETGNILYRDIQAFVADSFVDRKEQTPIFVTQGTGLEMFATINSQMIALRKRLSGAVEDADRSDSMDSDNALKKDLTALISVRDAHFVDEKDVAAYLEKAKQKLAQTKIKDPIVKTFFDVKWDFEGKIALAPGIRSVAEWLSDGRKDRAYFVRLEHKTVERPSHRLNTIRYLTSATRFLNPLDESKVEMVKVAIPVSVQATRALPYEVVQVRFIPNGHRALKPLAAFFILIHSRTELLVLSSVGSFMETGWDEYGVDESSIKWQQDILSWKDVGAMPDKIWGEAITKLENATRKYLEEMLPKKEEAKPEIAVPAQTPPALPGVKQ